MLGLMRLRRCREHRSGDEKVGFVVRCVLFAVNRPSDEKPGRGYSPNIASCKRIRTQMHAMGAAGDRHVEAIVHEHAGLAAANCGKDTSHELRERRRLEVALAHLNPIDARSGRRARLPNRIGPPPVGDEADDHGSVTIGRGACRRAR